MKLSSFTLFGLAMIATPLLGNAQEEDRSLQQVQVRKIKAKCKNKCGTFNGDSQCIEVCAKKDCTSKCRKIPGSKKNKQQCITVCVAKVIPQTLCSGNRKCCKKKVRRRAATTKEGTVPEEAQMHN